MFLGPDGFELLPRGLGPTQRIGAGIETTLETYPTVTTAFSWPALGFVGWGVAASDTATLGVLVLYDEETGRWIRWARGSSVVAGGSGWDLVQGGLEDGRFVTRAGRVYARGSATSGADDGSANVSGLVTTGWINPVGPVGEMRLQRVAVWGEWRAAGALAVTLSVKRSTSLTFDGEEVSIAPNVGTVGSSWRWDFAPAVQLGGAVQLKLTWASATTVATCNGVSLEVQPIRGTQRLGSSRKT
jgi:hypothetical protein